MNDLQNKCDLIYFSPTATTRMVLQEIARGMGYDINNRVDITLPSIRKQPPPELGPGPVLIGAPVYAGRVAEDATAYFKTLKARGVPAVPVVLYGNREYEDALLELKNICDDIGCVPIAGGAFIGEHSYSSARFPIAQNRPDTEDLKKAFEFGKKIADALEEPDLEKTWGSLNVPGSFPYRDGMGSSAVSFIDVTDDCDECGICASVCPKDAIDEDNLFGTDAALCIYCCSCIKACPRSARQMQEGSMKDKADWLHENCFKRKEPEVFFAERKSS